MGTEFFGTGPAGEPVQRLMIKGGGLTASILTWGAIIQDLRLEGHAAPLVLGLNRLEDYLTHSPYFGATVGRYANRVGRSRFSIDGQVFELDRNEKDRTHLHGGRDGFGARNWELVDHGPSHVVLRIEEADGHMGYPGNCVTTCVYRLLPDGVLNVIYETISDRPTIANVCQHSYFNLDGSATADAQMLSIAADGYLPIDSDLIPVGRIADVAGTPFDFRTMKPVGLKVDGQPFIYDHNYCLSSDRVAKRPVAHAMSPTSGVHLRMATTEPGVQFYAGAGINVPVPGLEGRIYGPFAGFCLEAQIWPDAINQPHFPNALLKPGEVLRQDTDYMFSIEG
ncbi:MAG: aldose 1-epimerase [Pseudomonadota bacterium]